MANLEAKSVFPGILEVATRELHSFHGSDSFLVGRSQDAGLPLLDLGCSRRQFRVFRRDLQFYLEPLSQRSPTYIDGHPVNCATLLPHGATISAGSSKVVFLEHPEPKMPEFGVAVPVAVAPTFVPQAMAAPDDRTVMVGSASIRESLSLDRPIPLTGQMLIGRDLTRVQIPLQHANVSRIHAQIGVQGTNVFVLDLNSANGTFVNGDRIEAAVALRAGDQIDIGPYSLMFDGRALIPRSLYNNAELAARNLVRTVNDSASRNTITILDHVSIVIRPREFVCILGPSGSGKSTLLSALSGRFPADSGEVLLNNRELYANFDALKQGIAVVPQRDAVHESLSVEQALTYSARLRLPSDLDVDEVRKVVDEIIRTMGLEERRHTQIRYLSGGQLKRTSLANEMISQPSLLFVDEATSGLDEHTDREMMCLFRKLADGGKTVVCITHNLANVEASCHLLIVLTSGGKLAFVGPCAEALQYFRVNRLGDIYLELGKRPADEWQKVFEKHPLFHRYVRDRLPQATAPSPHLASKAERKWSDDVAHLRHQLRVLLQRYCRIQLNNRPALAMTGTQCLLVSLLLIMVYGDISAANLFEEASYSKTLLFLISVSCLWFGCNNAAKEIAKERLIYSRERSVNLSLVGYYLSKVLLLGGLSIAQAWCLLILTKMCTALPGAFLPQLLTVTALAVTGTALGLAISTLSPSEDVAVTVIPMVLIPQIIFGGVVAPLSGFTEFIANVFVSAYWGYHSLSATLPENLKIVVGSRDSSSIGGMFVLIVHTIVLVAVAVLSLLARERRDRTYAEAWNAWVEWTKRRIEQISANPSSR